MTSPIQYVFFATLCLNLLGGATEKEVGPPDLCACETSKVKNGWCSRCNTGFVASFRVSSQLLFEALDAHGHDIDPSCIQCPTCKKAMESDGYCDGCRMGFVRKQLYMSRLSYYLARGEAKEVSTITCPICRKNAEKFGWCDACGLGMLGNVAIKNREEFEQGAKVFERFLAAMEILKTCEMCAAASMFDGKCPKCRLEFKDGKPKN